MTYAATEQARARRQWDDKAIAQRELDDRESELREAEANLKAAQAQLQSNLLNLSYTQVRAPLAGRIGKLEVTGGNLLEAEPGAPVLTTLVRSVRFTRTLTPMKEPLPARSRAWPATHA